MHLRNARTVLVWIVLLPFLASSFSSQSSTSLRRAGEAAHVLIGTAVRADQLTEENYARTLAAEYDLAEPEDAMKWWVLRPARDSFDFRQGDAIVRFAQMHGMKVRGHCLLWGNNNPEWLTQGNFSAEELSRLAEQHIETVVRHYAGQVFAWDVVNEGLDENGDPRQTIWNRGTAGGIREDRLGYMEQAFRWARAADPNALLFYNEAEAEGLGRKSDAVYSMLKDFRGRGVPVDGVGLQMHIFNLKLDADAVTANIARLIALGLQVHITELDVEVPVDENGNPRDSTALQSQAAIYAAVVRSCRQNPGCTAIQTWGFTDKYSWIGSHSHHTQGAALPFDRNYQKKAAYDAILRALQDK